MLVEAAVSLLSAELMSLALLAWSSVSVKVDILMSIVECGGNVSCWKYSRC
jgi:hypothetical protein